MSIALIFVVIIACVTLFSCLSCVEYEAGVEGVEARQNYDSWRTGKIEGG